MTWVGGGHVVGHGACEHGHGHTWVCTCMGVYERTDVWLYVCVELG